MSKIQETIATAIYSAINGYNDSYTKIYNSLEPLNFCTVKVYCESKDIKLPVYAKEDDAGMDVVATAIEYDKDKYRFICHTGLHFELPEGYEMELRPRSSNTKYRVIIANSPGTLDAGYRGELLVIFTPLDLEDKNSFPYKEGDRVCQLLVRRREKIIWEKVNSLEELSNSERGKGGFGSSGK